MKTNHKFELPTLLATALVALIALQVVVQPVMAATVYAWDFSGDHGFYNADTASLQATRPIASEAGGFLWTTNLQSLYANSTLTGIQKVCFILPTTGGLGTIGVDEIRGADIAVSQANAILNMIAANHPTVNFTDANRQDSATNPTIAKAGFDTLVSQGCQVTIGAAGSGETSGFLADADADHVPTISPSSTAASLAISGDYLFRTPGNDLVQSPATASWAYSIGLRYIAIIARNDPYGTGLANGIHDAFIAKGGTANAPIIYDPTSTSAQQTATDTLNTQIGTLLGSHPASQVGVIVIAFADDGTTIFDKARTETNLPNVRWVGTDGVAGDRAFVPPPVGTSSVQVAAFLAKVNLTGTQPTAPTLGTNGALSANLAFNGTSVPKNGGGSLDLSGTGYFSIYGITPQPYWDYAYDAAVIAMLAILKGNSYTGTSIADWLGINGNHSIANITIGATGLDSLAPTGDRAKQHYIIYGYTATSQIITTPALPNAFVALLSLLFASSAAIAVARKRRI
jgi:ABC-type branched-subunit amino acid transport system substrate-binding protein